jgi:hypothetical protein
MAETQKLSMADIVGDMDSEQCRQLAEAGKDEENPPILLLLHQEALRRLSNVIIAYSGPIPPPVGLVLPTTMTPTALMVALLDYLRGYGTVDVGPPPIGLTCLPGQQLIRVGIRASRLENSQWFTALVCSAPDNLKIEPIASIWVPIPGDPNGLCERGTPRPLPPNALWD